MMEIYLNGCPALVIRPLFLPNFLQGRDFITSLLLFLPNLLQGRDFTTKPLEDEESFPQWPTSTIYVLFGILAIKPQEQLVQGALGIKGSMQPFF
jgi:hypothetical protein